MSIRKFADWKFGLRTLKNGMQISSLTESSSNTASVVKLITGPLLDAEVRTACVIVRSNPKITVSELREELPTLSIHSSDQHLTSLIASRGHVPVRDFTAEMLEDATAGHGLSKETILWYRAHNPRQIKSTTRGRPRKK